MMKNIFKIIVLLPFVVLISAGCKKDFLDEKPMAVIAPDNLYVNKAGFESGLYGLYNLVRRERGGIDGGFNSNSSNDLYLTAAFIGVDNAFAPFPAGGNAPERMFNSFGVLMNSTQGYLSNLWAWLYQTINAANTIIGRAENPAINWTAAEKNQIVG